MTSSLLHLDAVTKRYDSSSPFTALRGITFQGPGGHVVLILGPSGSGKTTLLLVAAGLLRPTSGEVSLFGRPLSAYSPEELRRLRAERLGFVFQNHRLLTTLTAEENVALACSFVGVRHADGERDVEAALAGARIEHCRSRRVGELSHGEQQRVALARSIVNRPSLLLADEPTASLESAQSLSVFALFRDYARRTGACVVVASHDERMTSYADRVLRLSDGVLVEDE